MIAKLSAALAVGAALAFPAAAGPQATLVKIGNFTFAHEVTVPVGATVTWTNDDDIPHTVVAVDKSFRSKVLDTGESYTVTFNTAGTFAYFCSIHPQMIGKVIVKPS